MTNLETFAQTARRQLREQVTARLAQVLRTDSVELREQAEAVAALQAEIKKSTKDAVIETVAYTWFNRFCALRFMDANHYSRVKIVSPAAGHTQPEILFEAKQGHIDPDLPLDAARVLALLGGRTPASQPQAEAYRLLLVATCNAYHETMPFLFEKINDWTELLLPADLLSENSIVQAVRQALTAERCQDVEVIGWLYQYYIAERKDEVFANLKKRKKIQPRDIPAATQLFTPHWIVRYLVENSLGRLWLQQRPHSRLAEGMDYYIAPQPPNGGSPESPPSPPTGGEKQIPPLGGVGGRISSPEELRICDPACGSGHMLTYAFDLLVRIYEEAGYPPSDIPRLILEKNLTGLEIDRRAAALAAFALTMKARQYDRRFLRRGVTPHIVLLEPVRLSDSEIEEYMQAMGWTMDSDTPPAPQREEQKPKANSPLWGGRGADLFTEEFEAAMRQFEQADNFGALIRPALSQPDGALSLSKGADAAAMRQRLNDRLLSLSKEGQPDLFLHATHQRVLRILDYAEALSQRYHVVIANPPYIGGGSFNTDLKQFAKDQCPDSKENTFAMFIERNLELACPNGLVAMITMQSWMFLSSFEKLRTKLLEGNIIVTMAHLGARAFDTIGGEVVSTTAFVLGNRTQFDSVGVFLQLVDGNSEAEKVDMLFQNLPTIGRPLPANCYRASATDFNEIPGTPIAYWLSTSYLACFGKQTLNDHVKSEGAVKTGNNARFIRYLWEVNRNQVGSKDKWRKHPKGGDFRRWYGNLECLVDWSDVARIHYRNDSIARIPVESIWDMRGITWTAVSSSAISFRIEESDEIANNAALFIYPKNENELVFCLCCLNASPTNEFLKVISPTLNYLVGDVLSIPFPSDSNKFNWNDDIGISLIQCSKTDWDSYETSWDFTTLPLLRPEHRRDTLAETYAALRAHWQAMTTEMQRLEEENNRLFIEAYGLQDELTPDVPLTEITLTCNPAYRYGGKKSKAALEKRLRQDTIKEFVSYSVGCMFGRYALDKPGLILANQGDTAAEYLAQVPQPTFPADADNVIPILDEGWFEDDIAARFKDFLRLTFGQEQYAANLAFVETALGKDIRSYFLRDFYKDHVKTYKKRPIYWLFSSPKGSFQALVYMHRYRPDTLSVILNDYLRQYRDKLTAHRRHLEAVSTSGTSREKTQALKAIDQLAKTLAELKEYEDEILYPLATQKLEIDLDDGVKVNYKKFGAALEKVRGLS